MKSLVIMRAVRTLPNCEYPILKRGTDGRLYVNDVDLFDLLLWVEKNPLTQFREPAESPQDDADSTPHHLFAHMFDGQGNVI